MDQPRPRRNVEQRPLIIERPNLEQPIRRLLAFILTLLVWIMFFAMWLPIIDIVAALLELPIPSEYLPSSNNIIALLNLFNDFPLAIGLMLIALTVNCLINWLYQLFAKPKTHKFIGTEQLATGLALDKDKLAEWQKTRIIHVEHGPLGRVINAKVIR